VPADRQLPEPYWHAAGFQLAGTRAVRIDMLERLSDLIRARVTWRAAAAANAAAAETPAVEAAPADSAKRAKPAEPPSGAVGDGSFRASPELMSVVGCSGEDFASILQALGFRRERRKLPAQAAAPEASAEDAPAAPAVDEIWRPGKRRETRRNDVKAKARKPATPRQDRHQRPAQTRPVATPKPRAVENSPFAVLAELRRNLGARSPEGS
jgi:ATP-dependent RNA helicase SUPV3L1/SUV3